MVKVNLATAPIPVFPAFSRHFPLRTGADLAQIWRRKSAPNDPRCAPPDLAIHGRF